MEEKGLGSIAFPSISTGDFGHPTEKARPLALDSVEDYLQEKRMGEIVFVLFSDNDRRVYDEQARTVLRD